MFNRQSFVPPYLEYFVSNYDTICYTLVCVLISNNLIMKD